MKLKSLMTEGKTFNFEAIYDKAYDSFVQQLTHKLKSLFVGKTVKVRWLDRSVGGGTYKPVTVTVIDVEVDRNGSIYIKAKGLPKGWQFVVQTDVQVLQ